MDKCAFAQQQAARGEVGIDGGEEALAQIVRFEPPAEFQKRGGVRPWSLENQAQRVSYKNRKPKN